MTRDEWIESELRRALEGGRGPAPCPGEARLVAFYRRGLSETEDDSIREHLAVCAACVELARDARAFVEAMGEPDVEVMPLGRAKRWLAAAAILAAALIAGIWLTRSTPVAFVPEARTDPPVAEAPKSWKALPVAAAAYPAAPEDELVYRSDEPGDAGFRAVMDPYARGDYAAAETQLGHFLAAHPGDRRASFYRGVSLLLLGRSEEAIPLLETAATLTPPLEEAGWYLAVARLKSDDTGGALRELDAVASAPGPHRVEAARLAEEVRSAVGLR